MKNEMYLYLNRILDFLTKKTRLVHLHYPADGGSTPIIIPIFMFVLVLLALAAALRAKKIWPMVLIAFLDLSGCAAGLFPTGVSLLGFTALFVIVIFWHNFSSQSFLKELKSVAIYTLLTAACIGIAFVGARLLNSFSTENVLDGLSVSLHQRKYACADNAMPEGHLKNLGPRSKSDSPALILSSENLQKLYIKGMVGEKYSGNAWESLDEEQILESKDLFYQLHQKGFFGQEILSQAAEAVGSEGYCDLNIKNLNACQRYNYLPYGLASSEVLDERFITDCLSYAKTDEISIKMLNGSLPEWYELSLKIYENQDNLGEFPIFEQSYRDFVYENYLQITEESLAVCRRLFDEGTKERGLSEILELITDTLSEELTYNEVCLTDNEENDFFQYTIEQEKQGYDVHYATATTLMLRYLGVPARYVEGYYLSADEAKSYEELGTITLDESHAHAWAEFYLDGIGWIPFETTPGYIDDEELSRVYGVAKDALENTSLFEKTYEENSLSYEAPKRSESEQEVSLPDYKFKFDINELLKFGWVIFIIALLVLWIVCLVRRHRLKLKLKLIGELDNRNAIIEEYAYAEKLISMADIAFPQEFSDCVDINKEAIFSAHSMSREKLERVCELRNWALENAKRKWPFYKRLYYRHFLCLYK